MMLKAVHAAARDPSGRAHLCKAAEMHEKILHCTRTSSLATGSLYCCVPLPLQHSEWKHALSHFCSGILDMQHNR